MQVKVMRTRIILRAIFMLMFTAPFAAHAALLGTRAGAWEDAVTITSTGEGEDGLPKSMKHQVCHPPATSVQTVLDSLDRNSCKVKIVQQTPSMLEIRQTCHAADGNGSIRTHMKIQALSDTHIVSNVDQSYSSGEKSHLTTDSRWLHINCTRD